MCGVEARPIIGLSLPPRFANKPQKLCLGWALSLVIDFVILTRTYLLFRRN